MDAKKILLITTIILVLSGMGGAITVEKDSLDRLESGSIDYKKQGIQVSTPSFNSTIKWKKILPNSKNKDIVAQNITIGENKTKIKFGGDYNNSKIEYRKSINKSTELTPVIKFKGEGFNSTMYSYFNTIIVKHNINGTRKRKQFEVESDKVAVETGFKRTGENTYTQTLKRDNSYKLRDSEILNIVYNEKAEISDIDWNGLEHEKCSKGYFSYSRPKLIEAGVNKSLLINSMYERNMQCYNITVPTDSVEEIEIDYRYDQEIVKGNKLRIRSDPEFYNYIIGSGAAIRVEGNKQMCGTVDKYDQLIVEGTVDICSSGATIKSEELIEIRNNGIINAAGEDGSDASSNSDAENGKDGASIELNTSQLENNGRITASGGDGGDGYEDNKAGDGGKPGSVTIYAFNVFGNGKISVDGGDAGQGTYYCPDSTASGCNGSGVKPGTAQDGGKAKLEVTYLNGSIDFKARGGKGGDGQGGESNSRGSDSGDGGKINITANYVSTSSIDVSSDKAGDGGTIFASNTFVDEGADGGNGGEIHLYGNKIKIEGTKMEGYGGDAGDGNPPGIGGNATKLNVHGNITEISNTNFDFTGGDGGDADTGSPGSDQDGGDAGDGGTILSTYQDSFLNAFNTYDVSGGTGGQPDVDDDNPDPGEDGQDGTVTWTQDLGYTFTEGSMYYRNKEFYSQTNKTDKRKNQYFRGENLTFKWNFIVGEENAIDDVNITLEDRTGNDTIRDKAMTQINKKQLNNGNWEYNYTYNYTVPQRSDSGGEWIAIATVEDIYGNSRTVNHEFDYQYYNRNINAPIQGAAVFGQPIRFDQDVTYTNPSNTNYNGPVQLKFPLPESSTFKDVEVRRPDDTLVPSITDVQNELVKWNASRLNSGETEEYRITWFMEEIERSSVSDVDDVSPEKRVATENFTYTNPSSKYSLSDVRLRADYYSPERTVAVELYDGQGNEITQNSDYNIFYTDEDADGLEDAINFEIDSLAPDQSKDFGLVTDLGQPIETYRKPVILNRPVEPGKPIKWRIGYSFQNDNDFQVPYSYRMRVPDDAYDITLQGSRKDQRFDTEGSYILFERNLQPNSNSTAFLKYRTRSISSPPVRTIEPERNYVEEGGLKQKIVNIENLVEQPIQNINRTVSIDYGEDLKVIGTENETIIDTKKKVNDQYTLTLDNLSASESAEYRITYRVPVAESKKIREGTADGSKLSIWEITRNGVNPISNVWFETEQIDCTQVKEIMVVGVNGSVSDGEEIEDYECGSTLVPLGTLSSNEKLRIGITYVSSKPKTETSPIMNFFSSFWIYPIIGAGIIVLIEIIGLIANQFNIVHWKRKDN